MAEAEMKDNSAKVKAEIMRKARRAMRIVGMKAESYAKALSPVDTGLLRNSITFALGGGKTSTQIYTSDSGDISGSYEMEAPADSDSEITLYVGTNVHYAPYQELGHNTVNGKFVQPQAFLRPAMENHKDEYERIIQQEMNK